MKPELEQRYVETGKVLFVWRDFAWIGQESRLATQAARCAGRQGRFWEYHDHLYRNQRGENRGQFAASNLKTFAVDLNLDAAAFNGCLDRADDLPAIQQELVTFRARGVNYTPFLSINGRQVQGGQEGPLFEAIEAELARTGR